jgi:hypothetical protein
MPTFGIRYVRFSALILLAGILKINTNLFRGEIPDDWWSLTSLETVHLVRLGPTLESDVNPT